MIKPRRRPPTGSLPANERWRHEVRGLLSLLVFLLVTAAAFRSWEFALLVTASLGFHEVGHALALVWFRLDYRIVFGVVGAYTWSRLPQRTALTHLQNTCVHLAGPLFSLGLALLALVIQQAWPENNQHLLHLANFSAQVGFLNLLPLGSLTDGGKAMRRMALSAGANSQRLLILVLGTAALVGPLLGAAWPVWQGGLRAIPAAGAGLALIGIWLAASLLLELRRGAPEPFPGQTMSSGQMVFIGLLFWDLLAAMLWVILATPFWLQPRYLLGSLQNVEILLAWIAGLV